MGIHDQVSAKEGHILNYMQETRLKRRGTWFTTCLCAASGGKQRGGEKQKKQKKKAFQELNDPQKKKNKPGSARHPVTKCGGKIGTITCHGGFQYISGTLRDGTSLSFDGRRGIKRGVREKALRKKKKDQGEGKTLQLEERKNRFKPGKKQKAHERPSRSQKELGSRKQGGTLSVPQTNLEERKSCNRQGFW